MNREQPTRRLALVMLGAAGAELVGCGSDGESLPSTGGGAAGKTSTAGAGMLSGGASGSGGSSGGGAASGGLPPSSAGADAAAGTEAGGAEASGGEPAGAGGEAGSPAAGECTTKPAQTLGPYPNKANLNRSDIRAGQTGTLLRLKLRVLTSMLCLPISGATVELWQCNALGDYSEYADFGTSAQTWLRGFQLTDASGSVEFLTIYPGWYPGRSVHVHFRIKRAGLPDFASQLYFDDTLSDEVLAQAPYTAHAGVRPRNEDDGIFLAGGSELTLAVSQVGSELTATFELGV